MMRLQIALLFVALGLMGSVRADVTLGISPTSVTGNAAATTQGFGFVSTGLTGSKISGIGLYATGDKTGLTGLTITLSSSGAAGSGTQTGTFGLGGGDDGQGNAITWTSGSGLVVGSTTFGVTISGGGFTVGDFYSIANDTYSVQAGISNFWSLEGISPTSTNLAMSLYYDSTAIPEPATMILTGSALAAGAIGAYFKRRRKPQIETAA